jgi:protein TonB
MTWSSASSDFLDGTELRREPLRKPFAKSMLLHAIVLGSLLGYAYWHQFFHGNEWGSNNPIQGSIEASMVSSASLPLPQDHPPTPNVLATETPSEAPMIPQEKALPAPDLKAIPIPEKVKPAKTKPKEHAEPAPRHPQPTPKETHKAVYGEAAPANIPRATNSNPTSVISVAGGNFGALYPWYVDVINRKVSQNWYSQEVQPGTPIGTSTYIQFDISRDGSVSDASVATASGVPSLDTSCLRAVQRVDSFGPLPAGYNQSRLRVSFYCKYSGR